MYSWIIMQFLIIILMYNVKGTHQKKEKKKKYNENGHTKLTNCMRLVIFL